MNSRGEEMEEELVFCFEGGDLWLKIEKFILQQSSYNHAFFTLAVKNRPPLWLDIPTKKADRWVL